MGGVEGLIYFLAQAADMDINNVGLGVKMIFPYIFQQHGPRHHMPRMPHEIFEQFKFSCMEVNTLTLPRHFALEDIQFQIAN